MRLPPALSAFNHRDFRLFFAGQLVSQIGSWMQQVGQAWLILDLTGSAFKLGLITTLQTLPVLVLILGAGVAVDRLPKRGLLLTTQTTFMVLALVLAVLVLTHRVTYWEVAALAIALGLCNAFDQPGRHAFIIEMVGHEDLPNAIAFHSALNNSARVVGPAVAGLVIARYGVGLAILFNGISFIAVIAALLAMKARGRPVAKQAKHMLREISKGISLAWRTPVLTQALSMMFFVSLFVANHTVLVPLLARDVLGQGAQGFGLLQSALGIGAVIGGVSVALAGQAANAPLMIGAAIALCIVFTTIGFVGHFWLAALLLFIVGLCQVLFVTMVNTTVQLASPDEMRGRILSIYLLGFNGMSPIGAFFTGAVAEGFGAGAAYQLGGVLAILAVGLMRLWHVLRTRRPPGPAHGLEGHN